VLSFFRAFADETRLAIVRLLAVTDLRAGELVDRLHQPQNAVSYHLKHLRSLGLLCDRRSTLDARDIYYRVDLERLQALYASAGEALHPGMAVQREANEAVRPTLDRPLRILFLCTHNRARSQLAEGITRYVAGDQVEVYSAGNEPTEVHPLTKLMLDALGIDTTRMYSKSMQQFVGQPFEYVITTCDRMRGGPTFPGDPVHIHWSIPDPSVVEGDAAAQYHAFQTACHELFTRIRYLLSLPHPVTNQQLTIRSMRNVERGSV
jgi:protein-tyrosine-phosphatase/DNA-binding transcriptional ArsR family regulator